MEAEGPVCSLLEPDATGQSSPRFGNPSGAPQPSLKTNNAQRTSLALAGSGNLEAGPSDSAKRTSLALAGTGIADANTSNSAWRANLEERLRTQQNCITARDARIAELEQQVSMFEVRIQKLQAEYAERNSSMASYERVVELEQQVCALQERLEHRIRGAAVIEDRMGMLGSDLEQKNIMVGQLREYLWQMHDVARKQLGQTLGARDLFAHQLEAADDLSLITSSFFHWANIARDNRRNQKLANQDSEGWIRCKAAEQMAVELRSERETLQHRLNDATAQEARQLSVAQRLAASLRLQGTRLIDKAFALSDIEVQRLVLDCWFSAIPCLRLNYSLEVTEKRCIDLDACLQASQAQLHEFNKQSDRIRMLEEENQNASKRIGQMQEERKMVVEGARRHVEDRVMVRLQSAIGTVAAAWEKEKQDLEAKIAELSRGNSESALRQSFFMSSNYSLPPSPRNDPKLTPEAAEFFRKRAVKENLADAAGSLLLAAQSLKKGYPFEQLGKADKRHITEALMILGRVVDSSLLKNVVEASKRWRFETNHLSNGAEPHLKRNATDGVLLKKINNHKLPSVHASSPAARKAPVAYPGSRASRYWG